MKEKGYLFLPSKSKKSININVMFRRDGTDTESQISKYENTPLKDRDFDEIINVIKYNEKIQQQIMNDPVLREKFIEKYNEMRHSGSDQTLPSSFWSKNGDQRRTHAHTYNYNTPLKSDDYDRDNTHRSPRFTQFTNTDYIGEEGKIYDDAVMFGRRGRDTNEIKNSESDNSKPHSIVNYDNEPNQDRNAYAQKEHYGNNFSFLEEQKRKSLGDKAKREGYTSKQAHTVDVDDNDNDLLIDGEENLERKFLNDGDIKKVPTTKNRSNMGSRSKSQARTQNNDKYNFPTGTKEENSTVNHMQHQFPSKPMHRHKHSYSQHNYDSSNIHPGYEEDSQQSSKRVEEMKISKTNIYDLSDSKKSITESERRLRKHRKTNIGDLKSPNLQISSQYINQLSNDREEDTPYHSDEPLEERKPNSAVLIQTSQDSSAKQPVHSISKVTEKDKKAVPMKKESGSSNKQIVNADVNDATDMNDLKHQGRFFVCSVLLILFIFKHYVFLTQHYF